MPASVSLFTDAQFSERVDVDVQLSLGEVTIGTDFNHGEPRQIFGANDGDTLLRDIEITAQGDGAQFVQLARGEQGDWFDQIKVADRLAPGERFSFWARALFSLEDREGVKPFTFDIRATS